jgi:NADH-quinone oxidoreductase subunit A
VTEYLPILIALLFAVAFVVLVIVVSSLVVPMRTSPAKNSPYESGVEPVGDARQPFHVRFYLVAVLFILFDIEAVFLYPWAVSFRQLGLYGLIEMALFIVILFVGYVYLLKRRALEWD